MQMMQKSKCKDPLSTCTCTRKWKHYNATCTDVIDRQFFTTFLCLNGQNFTEMVEDDDGIQAALVEQVKAELEMGWVPPILIGALIVYWLDTLRLFTSDFCLHCASRPNFPGSASAPMRGW